MRRRADTVTHPTERHGDERRRVWSYEVNNNLPRRCIGGYIYTHRIPLPKCPFCFTLGYIYPPQNQLPTPG